MVMPGNFRFRLACGSVSSDARSSCFQKTPEQTMFGAAIPLNDFWFEKSVNRTTFSTACAIVYLQKLPINTTPSRWEAQAY